ncbi:autotransporter outer membrane beta-barrel domain-containing protein [Rickettsiaceae bacterium]|nr:autotransporter outer membrane beta-barrel domain-containing protein [Rickettsiaceae bacterium]
MIQAKKLKFIIANVVIIFAIALVKTQALASKSATGIFNEAKETVRAGTKFWNDVLGKNSPSGRKIIADGSHFIQASMETLSDTSAAVSGFTVNPVVEIMNLIGTSAGEGSDSLNQPYGVWIRSGMAQSAQKAYGSIPSSTLHKEGTKLGAEAKIGNASISASLGYNQAFSRAQSSVNKIKTYDGHIVMVYDLENNIFINSHINYGVTNSKDTREIDRQGGNSEFATGKTSGDLFGGGVGIGYKYTTNYDQNLHLTPDVGIFYGQSTTKAYKEKANDGLYVRNIGKANHSHAYALFNVAAHYYWIEPTYFIAPKAHIRVRHNIHRKSNPVAINTHDRDLMIAHPSRAKTSYTFGVATTFAHSKAYEITLGYDLSVSKKFHSNVGYLKLKLDF